MKFDKFINQYISEAAGDLPPNIREFGGKGLTSSGALGYFLSKKDREQLAASRGKIKYDEKGDVMASPSKAYSTAIGEGFARLKKQDFTPKNDLEKQAIEEYKTWGIGEEAAEILYVVGSKIAKNIWNLNNLDIPNKDKKAPYFDETSGTFIYATIPTIAREALEKIYELFNENVKKGADGKFRWEEISKSLYMDNKNGPIIFQKGHSAEENPQATKMEPAKRGRLSFKWMIDILRTFAPKNNKLLEKGKLFGWSLDVKQIQGKNNFFALDARSTPNNWIIYVNAKGEGSEAGGKLKMIFGELDDPKKRQYLQKTENLPLKFVNGVPKYGTQLQKNEMYLTFNDFLNVIGYDTIYDVLYAKYVKKDKQFKMPDGKVIDLEKLKISEYQLSKEKDKKKEQELKTGLRPEYRPIPTQESLETVYEKVILTESNQ